MKDVVPHRLPLMRTSWRVRAVAFCAAALAALCVVLFAPAWLNHTSRSVAAYDAGALMVLVMFWTLGMHKDASDTRYRAASEDPGRDVVLGVVLVSVLFGFASAISILGRGPHAATATEKEIIYGLGLGAVIIGWVLIHTIFVYRYAHLYYFDDDDDNDADGGLVFPGTKEPNDFDFAYFSFVVGMTFQVSDVQVTDQGVRRVVLVHGLMSFAYNTAILALVINILSGLLH